VVMWQQGRGCGGDWLTMIFDTFYRHKSCFADVVGPMTGLLCLFASVRYVGREVKAWACGWC
jgi:hypothetical protein